MLKYKKSIPKNKIKQICILCGEDTFSTDKNNYEDGSLRHERRRVNETRLKLRMLHTHKTRKCKFLILTSAMNLIYARNKYDVCK